MGGNLSTHSTRKKEIIIKKDININKLYYFNEKLLLIAHINPKNILIMNIFNFYNNCMILYENELKYSLDIIINKLKLKDKLNIINSIYYGVNNLHKMNICHDNIKINNILISSNYKIFISHYCINEIRNNDNKEEYNELYDIYCIGNIINELLKNDIKSNFINNNYYELHKTNSRLKYININEIYLPLNININNFSQTNISLCIFNNIKNYYKIDMLYDVINLYNDSLNYTKWLKFIVEYLTYNYSDDIKNKIIKKIKRNTILKTNNMNISIDKLLINSIQDNKILNFSSIFSYKLEYRIDYCGIKYLCNNNYFVNDLRIINLSCIYLYK